MSKHQLPKGARLYHAYRCTVSLMEFYGRCPTGPELAEEMGISPQHASLLLRDLKKTSLKFPRTIETGLSDSLMVRHANGSQHIMQNSEYSQPLDILFARGEA